MYPLSVYGQVVNKVVAIVNDEVITQQDVEQLKAILYAQYVQEYKGDELLEKMEELRKDLLRQMIDDKLVLSRAKELNIKATEAEIDERLQYIKSGFPSEEAFNETLKTQGVTVGNLKDRYRDQIMMKKVVELEIKSRVSVLPSEIAKYYDEHREEFKSSDEKYKVRHILIKAEDDVGFELAKVEIDELYSKIKEGYDFSELAKQYSQGPNKEQGGDMGYISRGEMLKELDEVTFSLRPGEFSMPVKSKLGYHIFKVEDIANSGYLSLENVKQDIEKLLYQQKLKEKLEEWLGELRSRAYISIK
jgi:parvulin-like peptidyl-prolyl isomerase